MDNLLLRKLIDESDVVLIDHSIGKANLSDDYVLLEYDSDKELVTISFITNEVCNKLMSLLRNYEKRTGISIRNHVVLIKRNSGIKEWHENLTSEEIKEGVEF